MAPQTTKETVIITMTFAPHEHRDYLRSASQWHVQTAVIIPHETEWLDHILAYESSQVPAEINLSYCEWRFTLGDPSLFTLDERIYDKIYLVLGDEIVYWAFAQKNIPHNRIEGSAVLPVVYCPCCLPNQFITILKTVKDYVKKNSDINDVYL